jgi:hypothetical protein
LSVSRLTSEYGARDRWSVIKVGDMIFFMTSDERIYGMTGDAPKYLSGPIQDYLDSVFTGDVRTYALEGKVNFMARAKAKAVSFDLATGTWSVESYGTWTTDSLLPVGSFRYDTIQNKAGFDDNAWWIYEDDSTSSYLFSEYDSLFDSAASGKHFPFAYQTPFYGDGDWVIQARGAKISYDAQATDWLVAEVYDQDNVKIATDSFAVGTGTDWAEHYFWFPSNTSRWFSVKFKGNFRTLNNVEVYWNRLGKAPVR